MFLVADLFHAAHSFAGGDVFGGAELITGGPQAECFFHFGANVVGFYITKNGEHSVIGHGEFLMKRSEIARAHFVERCLGAEGVQPVALAAKQSFAHQAEGALEELVQLRFEGGVLHDALAFQRGLGEGGLQQHIGEQF